MKKVNLINIPHNLVRLIKNNLLIKLQKMGLIEYLSYLMHIKMR